MMQSRYFKRVFQYCDKDGDGKISPADLRWCVKMVSRDILQEEVEEVVKSMDSDGDGLLGLEDFVELMKGRKGEEERMEGYLKEAFGMYVMDGCECITPKSLKRTLSRLGQHKTIEECMVMIGQFDIDGDGVINFDEFLVMMLRAV